LEFSSFPSLRVGVSSLPFSTADGCLLALKPVLDRDRVEEAYTSFTVTRADSWDDETEEDIQAEFDLLHRQLIQEKQNAMSFVDLFRHPTLRKRCIIGFLTLFGAQGTATLVINSK
jgi:hypothetical protein